MRREERTGKGNGDTWERRNRLRAVGEIFQNVGGKEKRSREGSLKVSWAARPMGFTEGNWATKLRADLEILS